MNLFLFLVVPGRPAVSGRLNGEVSLRQSPERAQERAPWGLAEVNFSQARELYAVSLVSGPYVCVRQRDIIH